MGAMGCVDVFKKSSLSDLLWGFRLNAAGRGQADRKPASDFDNKSPKFFFKLDSSSKSFPTLSYFHLESFRFDSINLQFGKLQQDLPSTQSMAQCSV